MADYLGQHDGWTQCNLCKRVIMKAHADASGTCGCGPATTVPTSTDEVSGAPASMGALKDLVRKPSK